MLIISIALLSKLILQIFLGGTFFSLPEFLSTVDNRYNQEQQNTIGNKENC